MGVHVSHVLPTVGTDDVSFIDRKTLIWIDGDQDNAWISQGEEILMSLYENIINFCYVM